MGRSTTLVANIITVFIILLLAGVAYLFYSKLNLNLPFLGNISGNQSSQYLVSTMAQQSPESNATLVAYALSLINNDRRADPKLGLGNVTLASTASGAQHAQSMLASNYFSHWDPYGLKPYMRYTLLGGNGSVSENVAFRASTSCTILGCSGNINVKQAIAQMERDMIYNDSVCCNNEHRKNILDPNHNQVSIGISYNASTVYLDEDFVDSYIKWSSYGVNISSKEMFLAGTMQSGYKLAEVLITFDPPVARMSRAQLANTSVYSYGSQIAGVVSNRFYYYPNLTSIPADRYTSSGSSFSIAFSLKKLINSTGSGEYTIMTWLNGSKGNFVASTYTVFVGEGGGIYTPTNV